MTTDPTAGIELVSVAAIAENRVIGADGALPWERLPKDYSQYRARVADDPVILGRRTFDSMRPNLPGRAQIVLSHSQREFEGTTVSHAGGIEEALRQARSLGDETVYVLGGADIYALFQPQLDRMVLSRVPGEYEGDTEYPAWDDSAWTLVDETVYERFRIQFWERRR